MKTLLTRQELAEATGLSLWSIGEMTRKKQMPFILIMKRKYLYDLEQIQRWLSNLGNQSMSTGQGAGLKVVGK